MRFGDATALRLGQWAGGTPARQPARCRRYLAGAVALIGVLRLRETLRKAKRFAPLRMTDLLALDAGGFAGPESLAELAFQHFSGSSFWQRSFDKLDQAGHFVFGDTGFE
jgi:hypothetical protein